MTDYKTIADIMQKNPADHKVLNEEDFDKIVKHRGLSFVQVIDEIPEGTREVWGNKNFQIIVVHKDNTFTIL